MLKYAAALRAVKFIFWSDCELREVFIIDRTFLASETFIFGMLTSQYIVLLLNKK